MRGEGKESGRRGAAEERGGQRQKRLETAKAQERRGLRKKGLIAPRAGNSGRFAVGTSTHLFDLFLDSGQFMPQLIPIFLQPFLLLLWTEEPPRKTATAMMSSMAGIASMSGTMTTHGIHLLSISWTDPRIPS
jgi:hypothetical protein